uniref:Uncharacterized protein n=1 Tax=Rhizophora mucronata TaxID=61149 RepID=A0A2P2R103_RHIMU
MTALHLDAWFNNLKDSCPNWIAKMQAY